MREAQAQVKVLQKQLAASQQVMGPKAGVDTGIAAVGDAVARLEIDSNYDQRTGPTVAVSV